VSMHVPAMRETTDAVADEKAYEATWIGCGKGHAWLLRARSNRLGFRRR